MKLLDDLMLAAPPKPEKMWWQTACIFPTEEYLPRAASDEWFGTMTQGFAYTVGFDTDETIWMPAASIERRRFGPQLNGMFVNCFAWLRFNDMLPLGSDVGITLGMPDGNDDVIGVAWIGTPEPNDPCWETNMSQTPRIIRVLWSSPLGWES
jgi:hypothetical protein